MKPEARRLTGAAVGEQIGVNRNTVTKWRLYDPTFQIALNRRRSELLAGATDAIRSVVPLALELPRPLCPERRDRRYGAALCERRGRRSSTRRAIRST